MSDLVGEAVVELRGDDRRLRADIKKLGRDGGKDYGKGFDDESRKSIKKSFRDSLLSAASRATGVLNIAGAVGPAVLAIGSAASAAAAGVTAVAGALGPALAAGGAAAAGTLLAVQTAALGVKIAFGGMSKAIGGDATALAKLTPPARAFATTVTALKPRLEGIRSTLQRGLFSSLGPDTQKLAGRYFPLLRVAARDLGNQLGNLADRGTRMVASGPWRRDFATVAAANTRNIGLFGRAGLQLGDAFRSLFVTAQPLIHTFAQWTLQAAKGVNAATQAARASGALASFWSKAGTVGAQLAHIIGNVAAGLFNILKIGAGSAGTGMLTNLEGMARAFRAWTTSASGVAKITEFFREGRTNLSAMGKLVGATTKGLAGLGSGRQLAPLVDQIRTQLLPPILTFLRNASVSGALSSLVDALSAVARVFASLSSQDSSMKAFSETLKIIADAALFVVQHVPGASTALSALFVALGAGAALKLVGLGGVVRGVGTAFGALATKAAVAAGAADAETGAITANTVAHRISMSTAGTFVGVKALEAGAWVRSTAAARAYSTVLGGTAGKVGIAAVGIAGVAASATSGSRALGALGGAASGAISGAALGSMIPGAGTVVGGVIGGTIGMATGFLGASHNINKMKDAARASIGDISALTSTIDQATGAVTRYTKAQVLEDLTKSKALTVTRALGIGDRQAVAAVTQQGAARDIVRSKVQAYVDSLGKESAALKDQQRLAAASGRSGAASAAGLAAKRKEIDARRRNAATILGEMGAVDKSVAKVQKNIAVTRTFSSAINSLPKRVVTDIRQNGLERSDAAIIKLTAKYHLAAKDVTTLIRENGAKPTMAKVADLIARARTLAALHPELKVKADTSQARAEVDAFIRSQSGRHLTLSVTAHNNAARAAGGPVDAGRTYLVGEEGPELVTFGRNAFVHDAVTTARALATGGRGNRKTIRQAHTLGVQVITALANGIKAGATKLIPALNTLAADFKKLHLSSAVKKDVATLTTAYATAGAKLKQLQSDIAAFRTEFVSTATASVTLRGFDPTDIVALYTQDTAQETTFLKGLASLAKSGLNKTLVGQLQQSGVAALPQVQAIIAGGKDTIAALNTQTTQLAAAAKTAGATVSNTMFGSGTQMASSLIAGLKSKQSALVKQMQALARAAVAAIRHELRMHSPSRVLTALGVNGGSSFANGFGSQAGNVESNAARLAKAAIAGAGAGAPRPVTTSTGAATAGLGRAPEFHVHLPTGDPEAAALAVWDRLVALGVGG